MKANQEAGSTGTVTFAAVQMTDPTAVKDMLSKKGYTCFRCASGSHITRQCSATFRSLSCDHCKGSGHVRDVCFVLHKEYSGMPTSPNRQMNEIGTTRIEWNGEG